jgi:hypothetical protein
VDAGLYLRRKRDADADWPAAGRLGAQYARQEVRNPFPVLSDVLK